MIKIDTSVIAKRIGESIDKISCEIEPGCLAALN